MPPKPGKPSRPSGSSDSPKPVPPGENPRHIPAPPEPPHGFHYSKTKALLLGLILAFIVSGLTGYAMLFFGIEINVVLPVLAPIWVGVLTLTYTILKS